MRLACSCCMSTWKLWNPFYSWGPIFVVYKNFCWFVGLSFSGSSITLVCYVLYARWEDFVISSWTYVNSLVRGNQRNPRTLITCQHKHVSRVDLLLVIMFYRTRSMCDTGVSKYIILYIYQYFPILKSDW